MRQYRTEQKLFEMIQPGLSPLPPRGTLGQATHNPVFYDTNGNPITAIVCGGSFTFDVPGSGLSQIWLTIIKDGTKTFDGLFSIPMSTYVSTCSNDVGNYQHLAYDPSSGMLLGQTSFAILPAGSAPPPPGTTTTSGLLAWLENMSTAEKIGLAAGAFLLLKGRKKR